MPVLRVLAFVAAVAIVVVMSVKAVRAVDFGALELWPLPVAIAFAVGWWVLLARGWALLVTGTSKRGDLSVWCRTQAIRYLPGGIWAPASRVTLLPGTLLGQALDGRRRERDRALLRGRASAAPRSPSAAGIDWLPLAIVIAAPVAGRAADREPVARLDRPGRCT